MIDVSVVISGLRDFDLWERTKGHIKSQWFPSSDVRAVWDVVNKWHQDHPGKIIPWKDLRVLLRGKKGFEKVSQLEKRSDGVTKATMMKTLSRFIERQMIEDLTQELAKAHENGSKLDHDTYIQRLEAAKRAGSLSVERRNIFNEDPRRCIEKIEQVPVVPLPSVELNAALRGGIAGGRPTTILTRTDGGKTSFAVACGAHAVARGYRVLHCTLEDSADEIFRRYYSSWTKHTWDWISKHPKTTKKILNKIREAGGELEVCDYSGLAAGMSDIELAASKTKREWGDIDLIIVDAGDDIQSGTKTELKTEVIGEVWRGLTRLSRKFGDVPVMVTTQTNRLGAGANSIELTHVAEGWKKATVSAVVLVFDVPKDSKRGYIKIVKTKRRGFYPEIPIHFDRERCVIR